MSYEKDLDKFNTFSDEEIDQVVEELELSSGSTPTSVVVQNGEVIYSWVGFVDGEEYIDNLVKAGMLPKDTEYELESNIKSIGYSDFKKLLKKSNVSAVILDMPTCANCYDERLALNELALKHDLTIYQLSSTSLEEDEMKEFIDNIGKWGYTSEAYEKDKSVQVPLLLFVKNGKIIDFEMGYEAEKTDLEAKFEDVKLIK